MSLLLICPLELRINYFIPLNSHWLLLPTSKYFQNYLLYASTDLRTKVVQFSKSRYWTNTRWSHATKHLLNWVSNYSRNLTGYYQQGNIASVSYWPGLYLWGRISEGGFSTACWFDSNPDNKYQCFQLRFIHLNITNSKLPSPNCSSGIKYPHHIFLSVRMC